MNTIAGIQVYQLEFLADRAILVRVSRQLYNLDTRLYQSVFLDHNYCSRATPTCVLFPTDCRLLSVRNRYPVSKVIGTESEKFQICSLHFKK